MELDQQIALALRERADTAPAAPTLDAIRSVAAGQVAPPARSGRRMLAAAAVLVVLLAGAAAWQLGGDGSGLHVRAGSPASTTVTSTSTTVPANTVPVPTGPATGWYVPGPLPGWTVEKAVAQAADGKGEAQLWLVAPSGAKVIISIKLPNEGPSHPTDAVAHPLPGHAEPAYLKSYTATNGGGGPSIREHVLWADWPGATLIADVAPPLDETLSDEEAIGLLDEAMTGLHQTDVETWRAFLAAAASVDAPLLEAATLEDLPDACC